MNLLFQILTQTQSTEALQLLRLPAVFNRAPQIKGSGRMSTGGKIASFKFNSEEELIKKVEARRFNELEVKYALSSFDIGIAGGAGVVVTGVFKPSPSNNFWFLSEEWPVGGDHSVRNRKMNARAAELALEHYKVKQKPLVFNSEHHNWA